MEVLKPLLPVREITTDKENIRVVLFVDPSIWENHSLDMNDIRNGVDEWLDGKKPLVLVGIDRVEVYEILKSGD